MGFWISERKGDRHGLTDRFSVGNGKVGCGVGVLVCNKKAQGRKGKDGGVMVEVLTVIGFNGSPR